MSFASMLNSFERSSSSSSSSKKVASSAPSGPSGERKGDRLQEALERGCERARQEIVLSSSSSSVRRKMQRKIAVCVMCVDGFPFEDVWRRWSSRLEERNIKVSFLIHSHHGEHMSEWTRERLIGEKFDTKWGSIDLVRAAIALMEAALKKDGFDYVAFCSETCLPVSTAEDVERELFSSKDESRSWIRAFEKPSDGYSRQFQFDPVSKSFPASKIRKADQWLLMTRLHARLVLRAQDQCLSMMRTKKLRDEPLWRIFKNCRAADEIYFPSVLALCGELDDEKGRELDKKNSRVEHRRLTWCDWTNGGKSPQAYDHLTEDLVKNARSLRCLFARKFAPGAVADADAWETLVLAGASGATDQGEDDYQVPPPPAKRARSDHPEKEELETR